MEIGVAERSIEVSVVTLTGRVDAFGAPALRGRLDDLIAQGKTRFVIDLSAVTFLDSAGLAALVRQYKRARELDGDVKLIPPRDENPRRILDLTRFDRVFQMVLTVDAAVRGGW